MKIELTPTQSQAVARAVEDGTWDSPEAFIAALIDDHQNRQLSADEQQRVDRLVDEAYASGVGVKTTPIDLVRDLKEGFQNRHAKRHTA